MAKVSSAPRDVRFSPDDLHLLTKSFQDETFRELFSEFAQELNDPQKQKQYEGEIKKWQKENGVDVFFLDPSPGFVVAGGETEGEQDPVCVNICSSEVIEKPSFVKNKDDTSVGHNWSVPHAVTKSRNEYIGGEKQLLRELFRGRVGKKSSQANNSNQLRQVLVYDVVFHPDTLYLANNNSAMKQCVIRSALDSIDGHYEQKVKNSREITSVKYVGKPMKSVIRKIVDKELHDKNEKLDFWKKSEDDRTSRVASNNKRKNKITKESTNEAEKDVDRTLTPEYSIKHVNKVDLQDFALQLIPQSGPAWRPQALEVEVQLPGVSRASEVNAEVYQQALTLNTSSTPQYKLDLPLPYPVDEDLSTAKFDVSSHKLTFVLSVIPVNKKTEHMPLPSPPSDSGIECDTGERTNSDGDNSSEVSETSQEDGSRDGDHEEDDSCVFESAPSSPIKAALIPSYTLKQTEESLIVLLNCGSVLASSVNISQKCQEMNVNLTSIGGGQTQLNYGLTLVCSPNKLADCGISHKINNDNVEITLKKANPGSWSTCQIGSSNCLATVNINAVEQASIPTPPAAVHSLKNTVKDDIIPKNNETHDSIARKPRVVRAVSMCEAMPPSPDARFKSPTCSWPRGILKRRSRSLSESQLGSFLPLESISSLESSLDLGILDDQDGEESVEESISSSLGEKKSVRFNDVVSRQLFRSNSSILEQKARKQKKNMRRKKSRERHLSESDRDSDISQCFSDPGPCNDDISGTTTTSDDDDDETEVTTEVEDTPNINEVLKSIQKGATDNLSPDTVLDKKNNNSTVVYQNTTHHCDNDNASNNNINNNNKNDSKEESKTGKKKRKNNKKKDKKFEPSNNFIFQLDIEP